MPGIPTLQPKTSSDLPDNTQLDPRSDSPPLWTKVRRDAARCVSIAQGAFRRLPRKAQIAAAVFVLLLVGFFVTSWAFSSSAKLNIICQHSYRSAEVSIWVDGDLVYAGTVNGSAKKRFTLFGSRTPGLFKTVNVPAGRHMLQVRFAAEAEGYDQVKSVSATLSEERENSLSISAGRRGLSLTAQGGGNVPEESALLSSYRSYASSAMLSVLGSGMSAAIAFIVQEFMRSQKARLAAPGSTES